VLVSIAVFVAYFKSEHALFISLFCYYHACLGWEWIAEISWKVDMNLDNVDNDGWSYAVDFGSFKDAYSGSKVKGALHFVRRRRLLRYQSFDSK
jgi:hypothetical protein